MSKPPSEHAPTLEAPRYWRTARVGRADYPIYFWPFVSSYGSCYSANPKAIYLREGMSRKEGIDTLLHELLHASVRESGVMKKLSRLLGEPIADDVEEQLVLCACTLLAPALESIGWLSDWPQDPE